MCGITKQNHTGIFTRIRGLSDGSHLVNYTIPSIKGTNFENGHHRTSGYDYKLTYDPGMVVSDPNFRDGDCHHKIHLMPLASLEKKEHRSYGGGNHTLLMLPSPKFVSYDHGNRGRCWGTDRAASLYCFECNGIKDPAEAIAIPEFWEEEINMVPPGYEYLPNGDEFANYIEANKLFHGEMRVPARVPVGGGQWHRWSGSH